MSSAADGTAQNDGTSVRMYVCMSLGRCVLGRYVCTYVCMDVCMFVSALSEVFVMIVIVMIR